MHLICMEIVLLLCNAFTYFLFDKTTLRQSSANSTIELKACSHMHFVAAKAERIQ